MVVPVAGGEEALGRFLDRSHGLAPEDIGSAVAEGAAALGVSDALVYLIDYEQRLLVPLARDQGPVPSRVHGDPDELDVNATLGGRAYRTLEVVVGSAESGVRLWLPLVEGAERLGVLAVTADAADEVVLRRARRLATITAEWIVTKRGYGDVLELVRRRRPMELAAEMRWVMLPPLSYSTPRISVSAILEPAYEVAGDCFDYALNGNRFDVAVLDAMGHGLEASMIANLAVMTYRHSRRLNLGLDETFRAMDRVVAEQFGSERFVTGQLAQIELDSGWLRWLNAGHPQPLLLRDTSHLLDLRSETSLPIGLGGHDAEVASMRLEPGDVILFFTDGVTEARSGDGAEFGRDRLGDLLVRAVASDEAPPETLRRLGHAILEHQHDVLQDDATLVLLRWPGPLPELGGSGW